MTKTAIIVESPKKINQIKKILGNGYEVIATVGHILDLDPNNMSIDIENNFNPKYKKMEGKSKVIKDLQNIVKKCDEILLATDKDREGEMIAWSVAHLLKLKNAKRMFFTSVTKTELLKAIKEPKIIDDNIVNAQKARRILDRIVGYEISPLLWRNINAKSAGRVQSVVTRLIIDKENEIKEFIEKNTGSYFKFKGDFFDKNNEIFSTQLYDLEKINEDGMYKGKIAKLSNKKLSQDFINTCSKSKFKLIGSNKTENTSNPSSPFTTSTLQQEANRKLHYSIVRTASCAQKLYEKGLITYIRTDSVNLSKDAMSMIKKYVLDKFGKEFYRKKDYENKKGNTQEAHEAIRPTDIFKEIINEENGISNDEIKLYDLIWKRTIASQMQAAKYLSESIQISISKDKKHYFTATLKNLIFEGYLKIYNLKNNNENLQSFKLPNNGTLIKLNSLYGNEEFINPPSRYSEASLVEIMDPKKLNIGRPATYPSIISKIQQREYVKIGDVDGIEKTVISLEWNINDNKIIETSNKVNIGNDKRKFIPTILGIRVNDYLIKNFPDIMDYKFTADMENQLDDIADGKIIWHKVLDNFYAKFHPQVLFQLNNNNYNNDNTTLLGQHPDTNNNIYTSVAKYGPVVKMLIGNNKYQFAPIKEPLTIETITLENALELLKYPKNLGNYERKKVILQTGKNGLYIKFGDFSCNFENNINPDNITLKDAIDLIEKKRIKPLAEFKESKKIYSLRNGPYGKYICVRDMSKKKTINVKCPDNIDDKNITLDKLKEIFDTENKKKYNGNKTKFNNKTNNNNVNIKKNNNNNKNINIKKK